MGDFWIIGDFWIMVTFELWVTCELWWLLNYGWLLIYGWLLNFFSFILPITFLYFSSLGTLPYCTHEDVILDLGHDSDCKYGRI